VALRLDPERAEAVADFDYFSIGVHGKPEIDDLAARLTAERNHDGVPPGIVAVLRYTGGNSMNSANSQSPATATTTASMRPPPAYGSSRLPAAGTPYLLGAGDGPDLWFLGNLVTWKATGEQTHGRLTIAEFVHPAGFAPPLHCHLHEDEIFYILSGTAEFRCQGERLRATAGAFVLLPAGEPHTFLVGNREPMRALQITTPSGFEHFAAATGRPATERRLPDLAPLDQPALSQAATLHGMQILGQPPRH
jgi:mannose-6-phosphate isomerase-like protein (cupin superfamily)